MNPGIYLILVLANTRACGDVFSVFPWSFFRSTSASASAPLIQRDMADSSNAMVRIADLLGPRLYTACLQNNVAQVGILTSAGLDTNQWSAAILAAASEKAMDVTSYCVQHVRNRLDTTDKILWRCVYPSLEAPFETSRISAGSSQFFQRPFVPETC